MRKAGLGFRALAVELGGEGGGGHAGISLKKNASAVPLRLTPATEPAAIHLRAPANRASVHCRLPSTRRPVRPGSASLRQQAAWCRGPTGAQPVRWEVGEKIAPDETLRLPSHVTGDPAPDFGDEHASFSHVLGEVMGKGIEGVHLRDVVGPGHPDVGHHRFPVTPPPRSARARSASGGSRSCLRRYPAAWRRACSVPPASRWCSPRRPAPARFRRRP